MLFVAGQRKILIISSKIASSNAFLYNTKVEKLEPEAKLVLSLKNT